MELLRRRGFDAVPPHLILRLQTSNYREELEQEQHRLEDPPFHLLNDTKQAWSQSPTDYLAVSAPPLPMTWSQAIHNR
jgi:hypothetical protein